MSEEKTIRLLPSFQSAHAGIEKERIGMNNRARALRENYGDVKEIEILEEMGSKLGKFEEELIGIMEREAKKTPIWKWYLKHIKGIGPKTAGRLIGGAIDPNEAHYASSFFKYCGLAVTEDGKADKMSRGEQGNYNPYYKKTLIHTVGASLKKQKGYYYRKYKHKYRPAEERKREEAEDDWSDAYTDLRAVRKMVKLFVSHWWEVWRKLEGLPTPKPFSYEEENKRYYPPIVEIDGKVIEWEKWAEGKGLE